MKAYTKGAVYMCSQCRIANKVYEEELKNPGFKIKGHEASASYDIIYNRPVIVLDDLDIGSTVRVMPMTHSTSFDVPAIKVSGFKFDNTWIPGIKAYGKARDGYAALTWIRSVRVEELWALIGFIENDEMRQIDEACKYMYGYGPKPQFWKDWEEERDKEINDRIENVGSDRQYIGETPHPNEQTVTLKEMKEVISNLRKEFDEQLDSYKKSAEAIKSQYDKLLSFVNNNSFPIESRSSKDERKYEHVEVPAYDIEDRDVVMINPSDVISRLYMGAVIDMPAVHYLVDNKFTYEQAATVATIADSAVDILLGTPSGMSRRIKDACSKVIECVIDNRHLPTFPNGMLRKHKIVYMLANKESLRTDPIQTLCEKYNISKKKAADFKALAIAQNQMAS